MRRQISNVKFHHGFTLLEVVVAMAIVGLGVVTLLEIFSLGLRLGARSSARTEAIAFGRQVMDESLARSGYREGAEEGPWGGKFRWRLQIGPLREEARLLSPSVWELKEFALQMRYREGEGEKQVEMNTLRLVRKKGP